MRDALQVFLLWSPSALLRHFCRTLFCQRELVAAFRMENKPSFPLAFPLVSAAFFKTLGPSMANGEAHAGRSQKEKTLEGRLTKLYTCINPAACLAQNGTLTIHTAMVWIWFVSTKVMLRLNAQCNHIKRFWGPCHVLRTSEVCTESPLYCSTQHHVFFIVTEKWVKTYDLL